MKRIIALAAALLLPMAATAQDGDHVSESNGVRVMHAWTHATDTDSARVYFEIENGSDQIVSLQALDASVGIDVALKAAPLDANSSEPVGLPELPIAPNNTATLEPEGMFMQITGLDEPLSAGDRFEMQVEILPFEPLTLEVAIEEKDAAGHSHADHTH
ncbi:copper chaperone PCu(A)C [Tranquillimonas rosea]|uniref:copper chaperone PCu(A)C n=1 Tax=Tranquillimonas rosea TaxID=641238 RepID=UPI003BA90B9F